VCSQRVAVVSTFVPEERPEFVEVGAIPNQAIPVVVAAFVAHVTDERAIRLDRPRSTTATSAPKVQQVSADTPTSNRVPKLMTPRSLPATGSALNSNTRPEPALLAGSTGKPSANRVK
jgi:hypothetical protein